MLQFGDLRDQGLVRGDQLRYPVSLRPHESDQLITGQIIEAGHAEIKAQTR